MAGIGEKQLLPFRPLSLLIAAYGFRRGTGASCFAVYPMRLLRPVAHSMDAINSATEIGLSR